MKNQKRTHLCLFVHDLILMKNAFPICRSSGLKTSLTQHMQQKLITENN